MVYAQLLTAQDTRDNDAQALEGRVRDLAQKYATAMAWFGPELTGLDEALVQGWEQQNKDLGLYTHALDDVFLVSEDGVLQTSSRFYGKALGLYKEGCDAGIQSDCTEQDRMRTRLAVLSTGQVPVVK